MVDVRFTDPSCRKHLIIWQHSTLVSCTCVFAHADVDAQ